MKPDVSAAVQGLGAKKTLDRDRALSQFVSQLDHLLGNPEELTSTWQALLALVQDKEAWESRLGGLVGAKAILEALARGNTNSTAAAAVDVEPLFNGCIQWLEDEEPRVRVAVGEVLGRMAQMQGPVVWERAQPAVMASIRENYDRDGEGEKRDRPSLPPGSQHSSGSTDNQQQQQQQSSAGGTESSQQGGQGSLLSEVLSSSYKPKVPGVGEMRHGTEGWRSLETSMRAMVAILDGAGSTVAPHVTPALADLVAQSMHHPNRYVREAAHEGVCALFRALAGATKTAQGSDEHGQGDHSSHESHTQQQAQHFGGVLYPPVADAAAQQQGPGSGVQVDSEQRRSRHTSEQQQQQQQKDLHGQPQGDSQQQQQQQGVEVSLPALPGCHYSLLGLGMKLAPYIADGLTDNWSQVRRTACVSARTLLLLMLEVHHSFEPLLPVLLPPLCLNRYYVAEGVRSYAQETWQLAMQGQGRMYVAKFIRQVADYYVAQSKAVHHGVREAACMCIAELAEKVERSAVEPHMPRMLHGMLLCFKDMAWPVRDAACVACGRCVLCYPDVCRPKLQELLDLWRAHLWDNVQSVRENSARALADAMKGYPKAEPLEAVHEAIRLLLPKAHEQPVDTRGRFSARSSSRSTSRAGVPPVSSTSPFQAPANGSRAGSSKPGSRPRSFGRPRVASPSAGRPLSPARAMEQALKEDPLFCPSEEDMGLFGAGAAARFSTSFYIKGDGCMDFGFSGEQQPWEASDGAVFMVRELAAVHPEECTQHLQPLVDLVSAAAHNNFEGAPKLRETVWRCLPALAKSIGKTTFKRHLLEGLLPTMMDDLACSTQLTEAAAGKAVGAIRDMLGPSIFQARLSPKQVAVMQSSPHVPPPSGMSVPAPPAGGAVMGPQLGLGRGA